LLSAKMGPLVGMNPEPLRLTNNPSSYSFTSGSVHKTLSYVQRDCSATFVRVRSISCPTAWISSSPREVGQRCNSRPLPIFYGQADADLNAERSQGCCLGSQAGKRLPSHTVCAMVVAKRFISCNPGDIYGYYDHGRQA
jgi:hypothetical protein